jgi:hypothetical protein
MRQAGECLVLPAVQLLLLRAAGLQLTFSNEVKLPSDITEHLFADDLAILLGFCFCCLQADSCCLLQLVTSNSKAGNAYSSSTIVVSSPTLAFAGSPVKAHPPDVCFHPWCASTHRALRRSDPALALSQALCIQLVLALRQRMMQGRHQSLLHVQVLSIVGVQQRALPCSDFQTQQVKVYNLL